MPKLTLAYGLLIVSALSYGFFWIWAMVHAGSTPKATPTQRAIWVGAMISNPSAAVWYWYVWKRWAFWLLFTPMLGFFVSFPYIVKSLLSKADATAYTNLLFALGPDRLIIVSACLFVFPLFLRLAALLHLGRNTDLSAMDRNDWVISFAFPIFGFGAGFAYCARYKKGWAFAGLLWWIATAIATSIVIGTISQELIHIGNNRRVETIQMR